MDARVRSGRPRGGALNSDDAAVRCLPGAAAMATMLRRCLGTAPVALLGLVLSAPSACSQDVDALIAQLDGRECRYGASGAEPCGTTSRLYRWTYRLDPRARYPCTEGAARCLESLGPRAGRAVPALVRALADGPNDYDTGDGVIAARSAVAAALGTIGDPSAIDPLARALEMAVPCDRGEGALESSEPAARQAIVEALGRFGPAAGRHWPDVAKVLRERHRNTSSARPCRDVGCRDPLASAAATALGAFGRREAVPVLVESLHDVGAAEAAAASLARLGVASGDVLVGLASLVADTTAPAATFDAAARALGALGDSRHSALLSSRLDDPLRARAAAEGLAALGPRASAALPALVALLRTPILVDRRAVGTTDGAEASRQLGTKAAAVLALERIGGPAARKALATFTSDSDVGHQVRAALARMERTKATVR